jgi:hypothetical protein
MIESEIKARKYDELAEQMENTLLKQANPVIFEKVIDLMLKEDTLGCFEQMPAEHEMDRQKGKPVVTPALRIWKAWRRYW